MILRIAALMVMVWAALAGAQTPESNPERGPVTNLPMPRFVSIKKDKANARRGPSRAHRIDWVYRRAGLPVEVVAEYGHWRKVRDQDGLGGWVHFALLSGERTVIVTQEALLRAAPGTGAPGVARFEAGVVARLQACDLLWCRITKEGHRGWAPKTALWGVRDTEVFD